MVDSGASRTLLPMSVAEQLGIADDLTPDSVPGSGVTGETFPTWSYGGEIIAQIIIEDPDPELWDEGGTFPIRPGFVRPIQFEDPDRRPVEVVPLLGRADFFMAYNIAFDEPRQILEVGPR